jgi:hypothetical protein
MTGDLQQLLLQKWVANLWEIAWFSTKNDIISNSINLIGRRMNDKELKVEIKAAIWDAYYSLIFRFTKGNNAAYDWLLTKDNGSYRNPIEAATILFKQGKKEEAYEVILTECESLSWRANRTAVEFYLQDDKCLNALDVAKKGVSIMPAHREVWQTLACACEKSGKKIEAKEAIDHARKCWDKEKDILLGLRSLYHELLSRICDKK